MYNLLTLSCSWIIRLIRHVNVTCEGWRHWLYYMCPTQVCAMPIKWRGMAIFPADSRRNLCPKLLPAQLHVSVISQVKITLNGRLAGNFGCKLHVTDITWRWVKAYSADVRLRRLTADCQAYSSALEIYLYYKACTRSTHKK